MANAFKLVLSDSNVAVILVNIFAGINRCDWIAKGVVDAAKDLRVPLVVRLAGTNVKEGQKIIEESGLPIIKADTLLEAVVRLLNKSNKQNQSNRIEAMSILIDEKTPIIVQGFTGTRPRFMQMK